MAGNSKDNVRREALMRLRSLTCEERNEDITDSIVNLKEYKKAQVFSVYVSTRNELSTMRLIERLFKDKKTVLIPFWKHENMEMAELSESEYKDLMSQPREYFKQRYNHTIPMPDPETSKPYKGQIDMAIVPGTAFSKDSLSRIGYGFGHYDRYLSHKTVNTVVGICHECQLFDHFACEPHDISMDILVTPKSLFRRS